MVHAMPSPQLMTGAPSGTAARRASQPLSLMGNAFLAALPAEDRTAIEQCAGPVRLFTNEPLWERGEAVEDLFFPTSGLAAELVAPDDGRSALARLVGAEGVVGAVASFTSRPALGPAVALTPCEGLHVEGEAFRRLLGERRAIRQAMEGYWAVMTEDMARNAGCAACHKLDQRLASLLLAWETKRGGASRLDVTHEQLCDMLGAQRTTVTSLVRALRSSGLIRTGRGWMKVLDGEGLRRRSCGCEGAASPAA